MRLCDINLAKSEARQTSLTWTFPLMLFFPSCLLQWLSTTIDKRSVSWQKCAWLHFWTKKLSRTNIANTRCVCIRLSRKGPVKTTSIVPGSDGSAKLVNANEGAENSCPLQSRTQGLRYPRPAEWVSDPVGTLYMIIIVYLAGAD